MAENIYKQLTEACKKAECLQSALQLLEWDQEVNMPSGGLSLRAEQNKLLSALHHKERTSSQYAKLLGGLIDLESGQIVTKGLSEEKQACIRELRRDYLHLKKIPSSFVKKFIETTTGALDAWKHARTNNSFKEFLPHLKTLISLNRKKADYLGYKDHPYDALLDLYEPDMTIKTIDTLFTPLKRDLTTIVTKITKTGKPQHTEVLQGHFPVLEQEKLSNLIIKAMGLSRDGYTLSQSAHPFCLGLHPHDIRMTTHFHTDDFTKAFYATIHETGHALYENGLPPDQFGLPLGKAASNGLHESQSRLWETFIGQSRPFLKHFYPKIQEIFAPTFNHVSPDEFYQAINASQPSLIRIFADEVTYNLHIILRYEIEKGFMDGTINPKDLPEVWNAKMQSYLGITPTGFADGCLQDIHWSLGYIGYFPTYTLGNLYAGALYKKITKTFPNWAERISNGDLSFILSFLREQIHKHGRRYPPLELIERATGEQFTATPYLTYLESKYL